VINGDTVLIAHLGYPTTTFKAPLIYNPWFDKAGVNAVVVPMAVEAANFAEVLKALFRVANMRGALITMPHKTTVVAFMREVSAAAKIAGACNAVRRRADGALIGDMFDGEGFVRGVARKGRRVAGASALVVGSGGVGSAIAASLAGAGAGRLGLFDVRPASAEALARRLATHYPALVIETGSCDPWGYEIVVNATPLGMNEGDPIPMDVARLAPSALVGEVVLKEALTPFLRQAQARGCAIQVGLDMLFEQIPAYLEFFGFPTATPEELRAVAKIGY
jgi:shikimate dehydrogenase